MRVKFGVLWVVVVLLSTFAYSATLHGAIYDTEYNLLTDVEVEINTSPKQNHISNDGVYFFYVPVGSYELSIEKYYQKKLAYTTSIIVDITNDAEFQIDIIAEQEEGVEIPPSEEDLGPSLLTLLRARFGFLFYVAVSAIVIIGLVILVFFLWRIIKKKGILTSIFHSEAEGSGQVIDLTISNNHTEAETTTTAGIGSTDITFDTEGVLNFIKDEGGRTTQKDIRKKIPLSEAKISLMISELESSGDVKKIKKGRGNIIVLNKKESDK